MKFAPSTRFIVAALAAFLAAAPNADVAEAQTPFDWTGDMPPGAKLRVLTLSGEISVVASSDGVARVRGRTVQRRGRAGDGTSLRFDVVRAGDDVTVCAVDAGGSCTAEGIRSGGRDTGRTGRANFTVEIPAGVDLRVGSGNGRVSVGGATADVHASSGNGSVSVGPGARAVTATSGNGRVEVGEARGPVRVNSGNGAVVAATIRGPINASTGNGRIEARMAALPESGEMSFRSGNGRILLVLPDGFSGEVEATTSNGGFESEFPIRLTGRIGPRRFAGTIGDGAWRLDASTGNGGVELRRHSGGSR